MATDCRTLMEPPKLPVSSPCACPFFLVSEATETRPPTPTHRSNRSRPPPEYCSDSAPPPRGSRAPHSTRSVIRCAEAGRERGDAAQTKQIHKQATDGLGLAGLLDGSDGYFMLFPPAWRNSLQLKQDTCPAHLKL